ncbi:MAG: HAD family hydrolase [Candidatus Helarchaeota archaeon]
MQIDTLIFDLGFTIVTFENFTLKRYFQTLNKGLDALTEFLIHRGVLKTPETFKKRFKLIRNRNFEKSLRTCKEITTEKTLIQTLEALKLPEVSRDTLLKASIIYHSIEGAFWQIRKTTKPVLEELKAKNYKLGVLSNAPSHQGILAFLEANQISQYFEVITTSALIGYTKPDMRTFQYVLERLQSTPDQAVMIGDDLKNDIWGAQQLGMKTILIKKEFNLPSDNTIVVTPDRKILDLPEILPIVESWNAT